MQNGPSSSEILSAIQNLLKDRIAPQVEGHDAYALRVAINSLGIVQREVLSRHDYEQKEKSRLVDILGHDGDLAELNSELCEKIRSGHFTQKDKAVLQHLKLTAIDQVQLDQPKYSGLADALKRI